MIFDDYDDSYDVKQLQRLPMYQGMTEKEVRVVLHRILEREETQWKEEVNAMLLDQRKKALAYMEEHAKDKKPSAEPVKIEWGLTVSPDMVDDKGFIPSDTLAGRKRTLRLSHDDKRKIYIGK